VLLQAGACCFAMAAGALAAEAPEASGNVPVNAPQQLFPNDNPSRNTSSIAASRDGHRLLVSFEDLQGLCGPPGNLACPPVPPPGYTGYAFSTDGGASWTDGGGVFAIGNAEGAGHPWVARLAARSEEGDEVPAEESDGEERDPDTYLLVTRMQGPKLARQAGLGVYRGHFGAGTFTFDDGQIIDSPNPAGDMYSRPVIAAAKDGSGSAYIALINVDEICNVPLAGFGQVEVWRTHDGGNTWQGPAIVSPDQSLILDPANPLCGDQGFLQIAPDIAIGPRGEVYVIWQYGPEFFPDFSSIPITWISFSRSLDGGVTFSPSVKLVQLNAMQRNPPVGYAKNRMNDQARIPVAAGGPFRGRIYVTSYPAASEVLTSPAVQSLVSSQVYVMWSDDGGVTWSAPNAIAPPVPPTGVKRIWPTVSVRRDGAVDIVYLESQEVSTGTDCSVAFAPTLRRTGPASSLVDAFWVQSRDGGATFSPPLQVSSQTSNWCTAPYQYDTPQGRIAPFVSNAGDYVGSTSASDSTLLVWPDDRGGPMDTFFARVRGEARRHGEEDDSGHH